MTANQQSLFHHVDKLVRDIGRDYYNKHDRYPKMTMRVSTNYWHRISMEMVMEYGPMLHDDIQPWMNGVVLVQHIGLQGVCITVDS